MVARLSRLLSLCRKKPYVTMTTTEVANRLVSLCREGKNRQAIEELYAPDIVSLEPVGEPREAKGKEAIVGKNDYFEKTMEVHDAHISDPVVSDDYFSISYWMDATDKQRDMRHEMSEIAVYQVKDGKVVHEQFFYNWEE